MSNLVAWLFASALFYLVFVGWWFPYKKIFGKINPLKSFGKNSENLFKGVPKPTSILSDLIAARVLQCHPEDAKVAGGGKTYVLKDMRVRCWSFSLSVIDSRGEEIVFDADEKKKIYKACIEVDKIHREMLKNDAETARQHKAIDVIESVFGINKEKDNG